MTAEALLSRLEKVRASGPDQWTARCPAHADHTPSLSVRELPDGRVLVKDFGGCELTAILDAVGLKMADLFPEHVPGVEPDRRVARQGFAARTVLKSLAFEATLVVCAVGHLQRRGWLTDAELERLNQAAERIIGALSYVER